MIHHPSASPANDPLLDWAPAGLSLILIQAARLALERQRTIAPACKPDGTLVTPADTDIEALLEDFLLAARPDTRVIGEESIGQKSPQYLAAALQGSSWVIDPVDGTVLYAMGMPGWGISLGFIQDGIMKHGVVVFPTRMASGDHLQFLFNRADGTVCNSEIILPANHGPGPDNAASNQVPRQSDKEALSRLVSGAAAIRQLPVVEGYPGLFAISQRVAKLALYRGPHSLVSLGSCVATFRHLMDGGIVAYYVRLKLWDIAAVLPLAWSLGLRACTSDGLPVDLSVAGPAWVTDPAQPNFLGLSDHLLFYRSDRASPEILDNFSWPSN